MEDPWNYPEPQIRVSEKIAEERDVLKEVREELAATDIGTLYIRREEVHSRLNKEMEIEII